MVGLVEVIVTGTITISKMDGDVFINLKSSSIEQIADLFASVCIKQFSKLIYMNFVEVNVAHVQMM